MARARRGKLRMVMPQIGDPVLVRNLSPYGNAFVKGRIARGQRLMQTHGRVQQVTVHYRDHFSAHVDIEPDWHGRWRKHVVYRELVPQPRAGDVMIRRLKDNHEWKIELVLHCMDARQFKVLSFDYYWYVVCSYRPYKRGRKLLVIRAWCRWCYSGHAFVPVNDPARIKALNGRILR